MRLSGGELMDKQGALVLVFGAYHSAGHVYGRAGFCAQLLSLSPTQLTALRHVIPFAVIRRLIRLPMVEDSGFWRMWNVWQRAVGAHFCCMP
jgi:hypothetical protein